LKRRSFILSVAAALASLASLVAPAQAADGVTVSRFPVSGSFVNPCTNENIVFSGTALTVIDPTPDNHGVEFHSIDIALKGVGETTGTRYVSTFAITISLQGTEAMSDGGAFAETNAIVSRLIAPGPENDLVFRIIFHFTINANGEVVGLHLTRTEETCV
jgi:hypothetical protein